MNKYIDKFTSVMDNVYQGRGKQVLEKHRSRGKLSARERKDALLDAELSFLQLSALAGHELNEAGNGFINIPAAGIIAWKEKSKVRCA